MLKAHLRLEGIEDGFDDEAFAQHDLVGQGHQPNSLDRLGRQDRRPRKRWANCRFVLSPVGSVRIQLPDPA